MRYKHQLISVLVIFFICSFLTIYQNPFIFKVGTIHLGMKRSEVLAALGKPDDTESNEFDIDPFTLTPPVHVIEKDTYYLKCLFFRLDGERYTFQDEKLISHEKLVLSQSMIQSEITGQPFHDPNH